TKRELPGGLGDRPAADGGAVGRDLHLRPRVRDPHDSGVRLMPPARRWTRFVLPGYVGLVFLYTLVPIVIMILYGFNQAPAGRLTFAWKGFTLDWYTHLLDIPDLTSALVHSLEIATLSSVIATILGIPAALALGRHRFRGQGLWDGVILADLAAPSVVVG